MMMRKERDLHPVKRFVMPALSICGCIFMVAAAIIGHGANVLWYLLVFAVIMVIGLLLRGKGYRKLD
jgi:APA family basic amino acid/polyamine antiporter